MQYTYSTLLASCQNYCIDNSTQYIAEFPFIVQLSEMRIIKDLNISGFDVSVNATITPGSQSVPKPSDLIVDQSFFIFVNGSRFYLQKRDKSWADDYWRDPTQRAQPLYYSDDTNDNWQIVPTPDQPYPFQVNYVARPLPMSPTNPITWLGTKLGELMLYATLTGSMAFFREDVAVEQGITQFWEKSYEIGVTQAKDELSLLMSAKNDELTALTKVRR
jgi:hypothetical protein